MTHLTDVAAAKSRQRSDIPRRGLASSTSPRGRDPGTYRVW
jgi:hypothetical protein